MTEEERKLWYLFLKDLPIQVNRQKIFGKYIVDFYIPQCKIVIEIDGSQHYEEEGQTKDKARDSYLTALGITVLRYSNYQINMQFADVCENIYRYLPKPDLL
jgi:very-short-patch-repair endonuclease